MKQILVEVRPNSKQQKNRTNSQGRLQNLRQRAGARGQSQSDGYRSSGRTF
jgi:hypothetical protein